MCLGLHGKEGDLPDEVDFTQEVASESQGDHTRVLMKIHLSPSSKMPELYL